MNSLLTPEEIELAFRGHNLHLSLPVKKDIVNAIIEYHQKHLANMTPEFRESMILTLIDYKGFGRTSTETIVDCLLPLLAAQIEQAKRKGAKEERERIFMESVPSSEVIERAVKAERERMLKIFASFGKIQLSKPLTGEEFEALFD